MLGAALSLTIVGAVVLAVLGGHRMLNWFDATELYAVVVLLALLALGRLHGTVIGDMAYSGRAFLPRRRRAAAIPTPGATLAPSRGGHRAPEHSTEVNRFRIEELTGTSHACAFYGEPDGGWIKDGEFVHATVARRRRSGELRVRRITVLSSANGVPIAQIAPARRGDYAKANRINRIAYGLTAILALGLAVGAVLAR